jgi:hypothetical protein
MLSFIVGDCLIEVTAMAGLTLNVLTFAFFVLVGTVGIFETLYTT